MEDSKKEKKTFKILSLDGGGMRGVISARILKDIEETISNKYGQKLHEYFDLVAGTSTGSILAAGIACKITAEELINFYEKEGKNIFIKSIRDQRKWRELSKLFGRGVLYPHEFPDNSGEEGLANVLKRKLIHKDLHKCPSLSEIKDIQLLILSYDVFYRNTTWFTNNDSRAWYIKNNIPLWKICTASASAPTFFPPYQLEHPEKGCLPHIDGGVSANNPVLAAIAHAISMEDDEGKQTKTKIYDIAVLSIGTGITTRAYTYDEVKKWGQLGWVSHLPDMFLDPDAENSEHTAYRIFKDIGSQNYLRLNFELNKKQKQLQEKPPNKLNQLFSDLNKKINKYSLHNNPIEEKVCEDIDNPDACEQLIKAAQKYLNSGQVFDVEEDQNILVRKAIEKFINTHPPTNQNDKNKEADPKDSNGVTTQSKQPVTI